MKILHDFNTLGLQPSLTKALKTIGLVQPTPIQAEAIPVLLKGNDIIAQAKTGTGKTFAFVLPILEKIDPNQINIQALIVTPTRELALQITTEIEKLLSTIKDIHVLAIYGGQDVNRQLNKLQGSIHIVVGTPGRILDHVRRGTIDFSNTSILVLDEADQMLHIGFLPEVEQIIELTPHTRQTMLFSATLPQPVRKLAGKYMNQPVDVTIKSTQITVEQITQRVVETTDRAKQSTLCKLIDMYRPFLAIIFCRTKRRTAKLNEALQVLGYNSDELHGDLSHAKREDVMRRFRDAEIQLLVATDVAARGLDVEGVTHVFNYDIPEDVESYIHRIGRTARAGGKGLAITLVAQKDRNFLRMIEKGIGSPIKRKLIEEPKSNKPIDEKTQGHGNNSDNKNDNRQRFKHGNKIDNKEKVKQGNKKGSKQLEKKNNQNEFNKTRVNKKLQKRS